MTSTGYTIKAPWPRLLIDCKNSHQEEAIVGSESQRAGIRTCTSEASTDCLHASAHVWLNVCVWAPVWGGEKCNPNQNHMHCIHNMQNLPDSNQSRILVLFFLSCLYAAAHGEQKVTATANTLTRLGLHHNHHEDRTDWNGCPPSRAGDDSLLLLENAKKARK